MDSAFDFKWKWKVDEALKDLHGIIERTHSFVAMDRFSIVKGYIGMLELDLKNTQEKLNELRIQSK